MHFKRIMFYYFGVKRYQYREICCFLEDVNYTQFGQHNIISLQEVIVRTFGYKVSHLIQILILLQNKACGNISASQFQPGKQITAFIFHYQPESPVFCPVTDFKTTASLIIDQLQSVYLHTRAKVKVCGNYNKQQEAACSVSTRTAAQQHDMNMNKVDVKLYCPCCCVNWCHLDTNAITTHLHVYCSCQECDLYSILKVLVGGGNHRGVRTKFY